VGTDEAGRSDPDRDFFAPFCLASSEGLHFVAWRDGSGSVIDETERAGALAYPSEGRGSTLSIRVDPIGFVMGTICERAKRIHALGKERRPCKCSVTSRLAGTADDSRMRKGPELDEIAHPCDAEMFTVWAIQ
jgi:hypothetical protein